MKHLIAIRPAQASDVEAIFSILSEVACQVPVKLSTSEQVKAMKEQINGYCLDGFSLVAVDENSEVVGFQLAEKRFLRNIRGPDELYIFLAYAGVAVATAAQKVFKRLIETEKQHRLPLITEVKLDHIIMPRRTGIAHFHRPWRLITKTPNPQPNSLCALAAFSGCRGAHLLCVRQCRRPIV